MRYIIPENEKRMMEEVEPWLDKHANVKEDAPQEIKDKHEFLINAHKERKKLAYS